MKKLLIKLAYIGLLLFLVTACSFNASSNYKASSEEVLETVNSGHYLVSPEEANELLNDPSSQFIDLRSASEFAIGHIENALNIPTQNLLDPASKLIWKQKGKNFILYGSTELAANGPWMLLRQLGHDNIKVLQGGYVYWSDWEADGDYVTEIARFPYDSLFVLAIQRTKLEEEALRAKPVFNNQTPDAPKTIVPKKKKVTKKEEGC